MPTPLFCSNAQVRSTICTLKCRLWAPTVDGRGMVSLATRQTPIIHGNTPACGGIIIYLGVWRVAKLTIPRPSTVGAHSLHFNLHIIERTFLRSWTRMELSSCFIIFQRVDPLSTARDNTTNQSINQPTNQPATNLPTTKKNIARLSSYPGPPWQGLEGCSGRRSCQLF